MKQHTFIFILLAIVLLAGLFFLFKPKEKLSQETKKPTQMASPMPEKTTKTFELVFKENKLISGDPIIKVKEGDDVVIKATSDQNEELHIHGYDVFVNLKKNQPASLSFTAKLSGRFPFELEHSGTEIGAVEVEPK